MVTVNDGEPLVKVIDFGVAKALNQELTEKTLFTQFAQMVGTPLYMSPEQTSMSSLDVDTRSDIYSLGVLLYQLLTSTTPFDKEKLSQAGFDGMRRMIQEEDPPLPSSRISTLIASGSTTETLRRIGEPQKLVSTVRGELDWIIMKALEKDRNRRYETANAFAKDVQRYLDGEPVEASPQSFRYRLKKFSIRNRGWLTTAALLLTTMIVGTAASLWYARQAGIAASEASIAREDAEGKAKIASEMAAEAKRATKEAELSRQRESAQRVQAERALYSADTRLAASYVEAGTDADAQDYLLRQYPKDSDRDYRSWEWYYLLDQSNQSLLSWVAHQSTVAELDWSPDGKQIATASYDGSAAIWNAETGEMVGRFHDGRTILCCVDWSPNGQEFAWGSASDESMLRVRDNRTGEIEELFANTESVWEVDWNQAGDRMVVGTMTTKSDSELDANNLMIWKRDDGQWKLQTRTAAPKNIEATEWSPDNSRVVVAYAEGWSIHDGESLELIHQEDFPGASTITWNPAGGTLACGTGGGDIAILNDETYETEQRIQAHFAKVTRLQWSPDNQYMASAGSDGAVKIWNTDDWSLRETFVGHSGIVTDVSWRPDSQALASTGYDGIVNIWSIADGTESFLTPAPKSFAWTSDNLIRSLSGGATVVDRHPISGDVVRTIRLPDDDQNWSLQSSRLISRVIEQDGKEQIQVLTIDPINRLTEFKLDREGSANAPILDLSHDLRSLAIQFLSRSGKAIAVELGTDRRLPLGEERFVLTHQIRWSPDDSTVAVVGGGIDSDDGTPAWAGWLYLLNSKTGELKSRMSVGKNRVLGQAVDWSPDGSRVVAGSGDGICDVYDAVSFRKLVTRKHHLAAVKSLSWHPNGNRIASASSDQTIKIWDSVSGDLLLSLPSVKWLDSVAWSPDGTMLAAREPSENRIRVWNARNGMAIATSQHFQSRLTRQLVDDFFLALDAEDLIRARQIGGALSERDQVFPRTLYFVALLQLAARDEDAYRATVVRYLSQSEEEQDPLNSFFAAWTTALAPNGSREIEIAVKLAERAVKQEPEDQQFLNGLGAILMRAERYEDARVYLQRALEAEGTARNSNAYVHYFLAMTWFHLSNVQSAREHLARANSITDEESATSPPLNRRLTLESLRQEAEQLINGT